MKRAVLLLLALVTGSGVRAGEASNVAIGGTIVNHKGKVFTNVTVYGIGTIESRATVVKTKSDVQGNWQLNVPAGLWLIRVDPDELIIRGYSCFPDWSQPVFQSVTNILFEVIPTRPVFGVPKSVDGAMEHTVTFDTTTLGPVENIRSYDVQQCTDQTNWTKITSISLTNSPIKFRDPEAKLQTKLYRAVLTSTDD
jgi:hypothetical protein